MLISTLVPTVLHFILLLASPIALASLPTEKRLALAIDIETYTDPEQIERQPSIRRQAGQYDTHRPGRAIFSCSPSTEMFSNINMKPFSFSIA